MDLAESYRGRRVLVTGHTGFKGSWLTWWLHRLGAEVAGYALPPATNPSLWLALELERDIHHVQADIRNLARLTEEIRAFRPEVVFHLAAQALVLPSYEHPVETFETNLMGTVNVLEACRNQPAVQAVVVVTSDKCYRQPGTHPFTEEDALGGEDPYSASKACAEHAADAYRHSYFQNQVGIATVRAGNVIGGGDWADQRLIPDLMRALQNGQSPAVRRPEARRPWQHVLEPLEGYLRIGVRLAEDPGRWSGPWNFGPPPNEAWTVAEVVASCCKAWGAPGDWNRNEVPSGAEAQRLVLDSSKAREGLAWEPRWRVEEALARSVEWYRAFGAGGSARALCDADLEAHQ